MAETLDASASRAESRIPRASIILPMRNEESYVAGCLDSVLSNDYPKDRLEILVIDGMSTDHSRDIVRAYARHHPLIRLLDNPKRVQAAAMNIGLREARGDIILRMDAHTLYAPDYICRCVELLETTEATNVGAVQAAVGTDYISKAIAVGMTTPFGAGDALFRYTRTPVWLETGYLGAWRKSSLMDLAGFDEEWTVNEDYELNYRLRQAGGRVLVSPEIRCSYMVRPSLGLLARQYFRYGFWRVKTLVTYPDALRWRQLAPPGLSVALLISAGMLLAGWMLGAIVPVLYLVASLAASIWTASGRGWRYLPLLPIVFAAIHISWGVGFLAGLFRWGWPRVTLSSLVKAFGPPT